MNVRLVDYKKFSDHQSQEAKVTDNRSSVASYFIKVVLGNKDPHPINPSKKTNRNLGVRELRHTSAAHAQKKRLYTQSCQNTNKYLLYTK